MRFVLKFGGSSLASVSKIQKVAKFISYFSKTKASELVVVVSAMGKTTDNLLNIAKKINKKLPENKIPEIVCTGERISAGMLSLALEKLEINSKILPADKIKIHAKGSKTNAIITHVDTSKILSEFSKNNIVIVPGFQAVDENDNICMLGRGGSDTTAIALASALDAEVIIFTDVKGFFSANPKEIKTAKQLEQLNIKNAIELSSCGAKIMEQKSLEIASANNLNLQVLKSATNNGTTISKAVSIKKFESISFKNNLYLLKSKSENFPQILEKVCEKQAKNIYFGDYFHFKTHNFFAVIDNFGNEEKKLLKNEKQIKKIPCDMITITGSGFLNFSEFRVKLQKIIKKLNIFTFNISISPTIIKIITKNNQALSLAKSIHKEFFKGE